MRGIPHTLVGGLATLLVCSLALAQDASPGAAAPGAAAPGQAPRPATEAPAPSSPSSREAQLESRLRQLEKRYEDMERRHLQQYKALSQKYSTLRKKVIDDLGEEGLPDEEPPVQREGMGAQGTGGRVNPEEDREQGAAESGGPAGAATPGRVGPSRRVGGMGAQGTEGRSFIREMESLSDVKPPRRPARVSFAEGLEFASTDDEFKLSFHDLTQAEYRGFPPADQGTLKSQFFMPRQRWYFTGRATKNVEFYTVINRGYGALDLLDAFMTINIGGYFGEARQARQAAATAATAGAGAQGTGGRASPDGDSEINEVLRLRVGRMKTPYMYEYYSIAEGDLIAPERSIYVANFAPNREVGAMLLGNLLQNRVGYSMGIFNGPRRSFQDFNSDKDLFLYLNTRPFLLSESLEFLNYMNIGACINGGFENNPTQPSILRTANDQTPSSAANSLSPTFLAFNNNVTELGERVQWSGHIAYFYRALMIIAEYGGGLQNYSTNNRFSVQVPIEGWMLQGTYFLTGERLTRRVNVVRPRNRLGFHDGKWGWGAFEVHGRFSECNVGKNIFSAGLADPNLWTNQVYAIDLGMNWYLNYYTKIYVDWQHSVFGDPVTTGVPDHYMKTANLFWLRFQVFF